MSHPSTNASGKRYHRLPPNAAEGCFLAHALRLPPSGPSEVGLHWPKGRILQRQDCDLLQARGVEELAVIRREESDLAETQAAQQLGQALHHESIEAKPAPGGRVNFYARRSGLLLIEASALLAFNQTSEALGLATLAPDRPVKAGTLIASLKVVPFVVPEAQVIAGAAVLGEAAPVLRVADFIARPVALFQTSLPQTKPSVLTKTEAVMRQRLARLGAHELSCQRLSHDDEAVCRSLNNCEAPLILLMGASAVCDRGDLLPACIEATGGHVEHFGMPVDPGNLLVLARRTLSDGRLQRIIILPGCARSPQDNGTDIVLQRALADAPLDGAFLMSLGLGGLLKESADRGQARE